MLDQGEAYEPSGEIHGKDVNTIISGINASTERPVEIKELFCEFTIGLCGRYCKGRTNTGILKERIGNVNSGNCWLQ